MNELHRPQYHFTPPLNWMNDPNGAVYFDGEYHLFYQYNPFGNDWGHMSWGHAISTDLVHWEQMPVAIPEDGLTMIFSGSAVVDWENTSGLCDGEHGCLVAIYTAHTADPQTQTFIQSQHIASSNDRGRTWVTYPGNPVLDLQLAEFRDPNVFWHAETERWIMVVGLALERRVQLFASPNLIDWEHLSDFGPAGAVDGIWECPVLMPLPVDGDAENLRWLMKIDVSPGHIAGGSGGQYFTGTFDGRTFQPDETDGSPRWVDYGADFYAAQQWSNEPPAGHRTWIAWMSNWQYAAAVPTDPWRGAMTLPREVSLRSTGDVYELVQRPVLALQELRERQLFVTGADPDLLRQQFVEQGWQGSELLEIDADIEPGEATVVALHISYGAAGTLVVRYDVPSGTVTVDRTSVGNTQFHEHFPGAHATPLPAEDGRINLHIFLDRSSVELFGNDGQVTITDLIFPGEPVQSIEVVSSGGDIGDVTMNMWELRPAR